MRTSGNGPLPSGYQTRPLIGAFLRSNPQNFLRVLACGAGTDANGDTSTVFVLIVTSLPYSGRRMSVPDPYVARLIASGPLSAGFGAVIVCFDKMVAESSVINLSACEHPAETTAMAPIAMRTRCVTAIELSLHSRCGRPRRTELRTQS